MCLLHIVNVEPLRSPKALLPPPRSYFISLWVPLQSLPRETVTTVTSGFNSLFLGHVSVASVAGFVFYVKGRQRSSMPLWAKGHLTNIHHDPEGPHMQHPGLASWKDQSPLAWLRASASLAPPLCLLSTSVSHTGPSRSIKQRCGEGGGQPVMAAYTCKSRTRQDLAEWRM